MREPVIIGFGGSEFERLEIEVQNYESRDAIGDVWQDNWLTVQIRLRAGGFRAKVDAALMAGDFDALEKPLRALHETLQGEAKFTTIEDQLEFTVRGDGRGHIELSGVLWDQPGIGNSLTFNLTFDQSQLASSLREVQRAITAFPTRPQKP